MNPALRVFDYIDAAARLLGRLSGWLVVVMMILVAIEVIMRYAFSEPLMVADEFSGYLLVIISYLGMAYAFHRGAHVRITFVSDRVGFMAGQWLRLACLVFSLVFLLVFTYAGYGYLSFSIMIDERSATWAHFPLRYPQASILIGFAIFTLVILGQIIKVARALRRSEPETGSQADVGHDRPVH